MAGAALAPVSSGTCFHRAQPGPGAGGVSPPGVSYNLALPGLGSGPHLLGGSDLRLWPSQRDLGPRLLAHAQPPRSLAEPHTPPRRAPPASGSSQAPFSVPGLFAQTCLHPYFSQLGHRVGRGRSRGTGTGDRGWEGQEERGVGEGRRRREGSLRAHRDREEGRGDGHYWEPHPQTWRLLRVTEMSVSRILSCGDPAPVAGEWGVGVC